MGNLLACCSGHIGERLTNCGIQHITNRSAEDPEATGLVEAFMKHLKKVFHTAEVAREDPYLRLNDYLMLLRAMKKCPAELLFHRKFVTKLPDMRVNTARAREDIKEAREEDKKAKEKMKERKDDSKHVKENNIKEGDQVLLKRKTTKHEGPFDPDPYTVTQACGTQVTAERGGKEKTRDAQKWKVVKVAARRSYKEVLTGSTYMEDPDVGAGVLQQGGGEQRPHLHGGGAAAGARASEGAAGGVDGRQDRQEQEVQDHHNQQAREAAPDLYRADISARLRGRPEVIQAATVANRPQRQRRQLEPYQAEATIRDRRGVRGGRKGSARRE